MSAASAPVRAGLPPPPQAKPSAPPAQAVLLQIIFRHIPEKYPDFYEYLETLQKQKEEDVERTHPDNTKNVSEPDTEVEEPVHEETSADLKEQVTKNLVEGEHTGNQRDSEAYR